MNFSLITSSLEKQKSLNSGYYSFKPDKTSNQIFTGMMTFVMGIVTMVRMTRNMPQNYSGAGSGSMKLQTRLMLEHQPTSNRLASMSATDETIVKRVNELEEKVTAISSKPAKVAPETQNLLDAAMSRIDKLEQEVTETKKVTNRCKCALPLHSFAAFFESFPVGPFCRLWRILMRSKKNSWHTSRRKRRKRSFSLSSI